MSAELSRSVDPLISQLAGVDLVHNLGRSRLSVRPVRYGTGQAEEGGYGHAERAS
jgi:hypothetical protein